MTKITHSGPGIGFMDNRYVNVPGDTMTGELNMGTNAIILKDASSTEWRVTVNTDGALVTSLAAGVAGSPLGGLLLSLTVDS